jgi:hypothetical protein
VPDRATWRPQDGGIGGLAARERIAARRIRWGILCLPLAGLVYLEGLVVAGEYVTPSDGLRPYAEYITSARFAASLPIYHLQSALLLVGAIALYAYLAGSRAERWALAGLLMLCLVVIGSGAQLGLDFPMIPAAEAYLGGEQGALDSARYSENYADFPLVVLAWMGLTGPLLNVLANLAFGVAIWRSGTLPQGAAILWVGAAVLGTASLNPSTYLGVGIEALVFALDLGGSGWIAWSVWREPIPGTRALA